MYIETQLLAINKHHKSYILKAWVSQERGTTRFQVSEAEGVSVALTFKRTSDFSLGHVGWLH